MFYFIRDGGLGPKIFKLNYFLPKALMSAISISREAALSDSFDRIVSIHFPLLKTVKRASRDQAAHDVSGTNRRCSDISTFPPSKNEAQMKTGIIKLQAVKRKDLLAQHHSISRFQRPF